MYYGSRYFSDGIWDNLLWRSPQLALGKKETFDGGDSLYLLPGRVGERDEMSKLLFRDWQ